MAATLLIIMALGLVVVPIFSPVAAADSNSSKGVMSLTDEGRTLTDIQPASVKVGLTPDSKWYGLKTFYEGTVSWAKGIYSKQSQADYLVFLGEKRAAELRTILEKGIPEPKIVAKVLDSGYDYFVKVKNILADASDAVYWPRLGKLREQLYQEQVEFAKWEYEQKIAMGDVMAKNQPSFATQWLQAMIAVSNAFEQQRQERTEASIAQRQYSQEMADYLLQWGESNKQWVDELAQYNKNISPDSIARTKKAADDFAAKVKQIKESDNPNQKDLAEVVDIFNKELDKIDQEDLDKSDKAAGSETAPTGNQPAPAANNNPTPAPKAPTPKPAPKAPTPKPVLKPVPSETVNQEPLVLNYWKQLFGQVNVFFDVSLSAEGGLPPYHYQLGTGGGFPPHGIVLDANGRISGTPSIEGTSNFSACVVDTAGTNVCASMAITIQPAPEPEPEPEPLNCVDCDAADEACYQVWQGWKNDCRAESLTPEHYDDPNWYNENCYAKFPEWEGECERQEAECEANNSPGCP